MTSLDSPSLQPEAGAEGDAAAARVPAPDGQAPTVARGETPIGGAPRLWRGFGEAFLVALITALLCRTFVVQAFRIPSMSMVPTLVRGDHLLINKLSYGLRSPFGHGWLVRFAPPAAGDVIVFTAPGEGEQGESDFVKRVVATAGEEVEVRGGRVYVDGRERHVPGSFAAFGYHARSRDDFGPLRVPAGQLFVLGDNRDGSRDSRHRGFVDVDAVEGKAVLVFWSWEETDHFVRWERIGRRIRSAPPVSAAKRQNDQSLQVADAAL